MELLLKELPETLLHYTGKPVPKWMRVLRPETADSLLILEAESGGLVYNDLWRSAAISLWAMQQKAGVQPPGFSAHGYGLAVDFAVDATLTKLKWTYPKFLAFMEAHGWFCHRRDGKRGSEDWHFQALPAEYLKHADAKRPVTWAAPVEARMQELYGPQMALGTMDQQEALKSLKLYAGDIDGKMGPLSQKAEAAFRQKWGLPVAGDNTRYQRTLAFVAATKKMVPLP